QTVEQPDYHSHNTEQLDVEGVKSLLLTLPEIQAELADWKGAE
ncbi:MAG TPA: UDP-glucose 4-epimerase, partial [Rhodobacteraceae bacterium]|nr:UDP-glucose 4-epimerase [Paracoccaceae bacterium]